MGQKHADLYAQRIVFQPWHRLHAFSTKNQGGLTYCCIADHGNQWTQISQNSTIIFPHSAAFSQLTSLCNVALMSVHPVAGQLSIKHEEQRNRSRSSTQNLWAKQLHDCYGFRQQARCKICWPMFSATSIVSTPLFLGPVPGRCNNSINSIPGITVPYSRNTFIPGINSVLLE